MDSINRNQPEKNREHLQGRAAIERIKEIADKAENCFFCTYVTDGASTAARPMNVRRVDDQGNLWFLSPSDSHTNEQVRLDPAVELYFQASKHSEFLHLHGIATLSTDRSKIKELWEPILKTWFTEGLDDPRITVIKVTPSDGYYWDTKHGSAVAGIKMMIGAMVGKTLDDSIEGRVEVGAGTASRRRL